MRIPLFCSRSKIAGILSTDKFQQLKKKMFKCMLNNFYIFSTCSETTFCLNPVESNILYWFTEEHIKYNCNLIQFSKENWIEGGGFALTFSDCWRTSFCVTTITKIVNNNTNDKQTSGASLALDEDSPYTNSGLFTLDRLPLLLLLR